MQGNRSRDTAPELAVRSLLHGAGYRFRVDRRPLPAFPRRADIVFTRAKVAVFIDGCFWHGCPVHGRLPGTNRTYWTAKLRRNVERDEETTRVLQASGWVVVRVWEHEVPESAVERVTAALDRLA